MVCLRANIARAFANMAARRKGVAGQLGGGMAYEMGGPRELGWDPVSFGTRFTALATATLWPLAGIFGAAQMFSTTERDRVAAFLGGYSKLATTSRGLVEYVSVGDGPTLLMLHGVGGGYDQGLFATQIVDDDDYRYLAVSRPGYLRTPIASGESPEAQADAYAALLDALDVPTAAVVGVSAGAPSALQFALRYPARCWGVVLIAPASHRLTPNDSPFYVWMKRLLFNDVNMGWVLRIAAQKPEHLVRYHVADPVLQKAVLADPTLVRLFQDFYRTTYPASMRAAGVDNDVAHLTALSPYPLERIVAPTLVVHGTADRTAAFSHAEFVVDRVPKAKLAAIVGGEHLCMISHRDEVRAHIRSFLKAHAPVQPLPSRL